MRFASPELKAFLRSRQACYKADLFTYTLKSGQVFRWGTFDQPVTYGGQTWTAAGPMMSRSRLSIRNSVEVPELDMKLLVRDSDTINGRNIKEQIQNGVFDGATVEMDRVFMPKKGDTSLGLVLMFLGRQSPANVKADVISLTAKGDNVLMNQQVPKNVYQTTCLHTFCDAGCTLSAAAFTITNAAGGSTTAGNIVWGSLPGAPALYTLGRITFTSGPAAGQVRTVKFSANTGIVPAYPFDNTPLPGDTFSILQGCDRTQATCTTTFANEQHFRGFPYVPPAEMAI